MITPCLYPALAGIHDDRPFWPNAELETSADTADIASLTDALKTLGVTPSILAGTRIPLVCEGHNPFNPNVGLWASAYILTIDALIALQVSHKHPWDIIHQLGMVRGKRRTLISFFLQQMPTLSHCVALWGAMATADLFYDEYGSVQSGPARRDWDACNAVAQNYQRYAYPLLPDGYYQEIVDLPETPRCPVTPKTGDARESFIDLAAQRIAYCLRIHRPVHFQLVDAAPSQAIADLLSNTQGSLS